jgi:hypothetical protein
MRKTITALIAAASAALMISGAGIAAASTRAVAAKTEHFQEMVASPTSSKANVIVYGAFTAAGVDVENANNTDTFKFPGGSFLVTPKFTSPNEHLNKATCLLTENLRLTYKISRGTGKYAGISGTGNATLTDLEITARDSHGACSLSKTLLAQQVFARGHGPVTLP